MSERTIAGHSGGDAACPQAPRGDRRGLGGRFARTPGGTGPHGDGPDGPDGGIPPQISLQT
ncbi:hypothetical protein [Parafrankia elaeagni]|uniref:hypothetical protein n=1 Tax=Parafrankia elaeagni TaxID=222534 RepID=UPI0003A675D2|nr:hypothetical protein [Parafrankia elaeagni]